MSNVSNLQGEKLEAAAPGQVKEGDFYFHCGLFGLVWSLFLKKSMLLCNMPPQMDMTTANPQSLSPHSLILLDPFDSVPSTSGPLPPLLGARLVLAPNSICLLDCP